MSDPPFESSGDVGQLTMYLSGPGACLVFSNPSSSSEKYSNISMKTRGNKIAMSGRHKVTCFKG